MHQLINITKGTSTQVAEIHEMDRQMVDNVGGKVTEILKIAAATTRRKQAAATAAVSTSSSYIPSSVPSHVSLPFHPPPLTMQAPIPQSADSMTGCFISH